MFFKIGVIKSFAIFTGKNLSWSLFLIKFQVFKVQNRCFSVKFAKFLRITVLKSICERLFPRILQEKLLNSIVRTLSIWAMSFISHTRRLYQDLSQKKENLYWSVIMKIILNIWKNSGEASCSVSYSKYICGTLGSMPPQENLSIFILI